ncbi:rod shape-determining protein RodA [Iodidimonas nitroreducens]|uniref:Peptidoglycan glycosyltransferase MrdB n=1 Tax=Iodidimonas nitroreducens TaxID=1236968 RepID=A0A5A7NBJ5_9PROT|nr:rod shape-determining protein RodA [Iodidimonas nitroreducens]GAK33117.1 rod shape-determining protein RodA [alpha proteobacterium Q-1]GER05084.1 rod shape-determining protein RodA [Iodidimonas nitroreducens]
MSEGYLFAPRKVKRSLPQKLLDLNWLVIAVLILIAGVGVAMLYSVGGGHFDPWARQQAIRFGALFLLMIAIALVDLRFWFQLAYPAFFGALALLIAVEFIGVVGMGGQRWLDLGFMRLQPSEIMKIALVMAMARYYHGLNATQSGQYVRLIPPFLMVLLPMALIVRQPDLGTALMLAAGGMAVLFLAGAPKWLFLGGVLAAAAAVPVAWGFLHDYQQQRILTFVNPESDPLGAGYQIMQSKIALGSGGLTGKGFLMGTQSHLNFLPEMKTDFIFTALAEEFGLVGGMGVIALYLFILAYGFYVAATCRNQFGRLLASGLSLTMFLYVFINVGMVMGILPVVGVPLPMISYGGSAMLTMLTAFGLIFSVSLNRKLVIPKGL